MFGALLFFTLSLFSSTVIILGGRLGQYAERKSDRGNGNGEAGCASAHVTELELPEEEKCADVGGEAPENADPWEAALDMAKAQER